ncbi:glycine betaine ABC transporter substrate-binding protein [Microcystis aeruginosa]|uniref:Glycine/betaine transport system permease protein n=2 Tax=Microcystis aeruginosa TaxID=1126 RepID=A0A6H9GCU6_MICAE|nr:glycine betaine ABC transporter substrate-binding protein [Microcystis aeruginosa]GCL44362.1 glycine/betaine transport system permease protein [Microcystis aeruginosa NIES-3787]GCL58462.1 glycine/betaine transport system permease protein [Microcystis aeruginosa NIES-3807]
MDSFWLDYAGEIAFRTGEHLFLTGIAMAMGSLIGIPLGILISRQAILAPPIIAIVNTLQTIPSLALFGFLISVPFLGGIGKIPAIVALTLYTLLPIVLNTYLGIKKVDPELKLAGLSLGMTDGQILRYIELPLARATILAGVRIATVIAIGVATIAAAIGGGGLGVFIFRGIATVNNQLILAGAIPAAFLALVADWSLGWLEKTFSPSQRPKKPSKWQWGLGLIGLALLSFLLTQIFHSSPSTVVIGSKNFTEQVILGEILAQEIEKETNLRVERQFNLGGTLICHEAVKAGKIDGYVEYSGTAFTGILQEKPLNDARLVSEKLQEIYPEKFNLEVFPSLGFENTFAIVIRGETASQYNLKTLSQVAKYTPNWQAGFGYEFLEREDGYKGLAKTYGLNFARPPKVMDLGLMYRALAEKQVDLVAGNSTDGLIPVLDLVILEDDQRYFPPYEAVPIFNLDSLQKYPQLRQVLAKLTGKITSTAMQKLNYQVDGRDRKVEEVVKEFLVSLS